jgi:hypothetical protein
MWMNFYGRIAVQGEIVRHIGAVKVVFDLKIFDCFFHAIANAFAIILLTYLSVELIGIQIQKSRQTEI